MNEFVRIFSRRILIIFTVLMILNAGIFVISVRTQKDVTLTGEALEQYIEEYPEFIGSALENSGNMSVLDMYKSGFAAENIRKTAEAYRNLGTPELKYADNTGTAIFVQYRLTDMFIAAFLLMITVNMLEERRKGLVYMIRSTSGGRLKLYITRTLITAFSSAVSVILFYGTDLAVMTAVKGMPDLSASLQSLPEFMKCPFSLSTGGFIVRMFIVKSAVFFVLSMAFFLCISVFNTAAAYTVFGASAAVEAVLYMAVPLVSSLNAVKYLNVFAVLGVTDIYNECRFINIFGNAFSADLCLRVIVPAASAVLFTAGAAVHGKCHVTAHGSSGRISELLSGLREKTAFQHTLAGWEIYKLFIKQGGIIFMAAAFFMAFSAASKYSYTEEKTALNQAEWFIKYSGVITDESLEEAETDLSQLDGLIAFYHDNINELNETLLLKTDEEDTGRINRYISDIENDLEKAQYRRDGLIPVMENIRSGIEYTGRTGNDIYLIEQNIYETFLLNDRYSVRRASLFILIGIIGAVSGVYAFDSQNNMRNTIRTSVKGRINIHFAKLVPVILFCAVMSTSLHLIQFIQIGHAFGGYNDTVVPVQSINFMRDFGLYISVRDFLIFLFSVRAAAAVLAGLICSAVSRLCRDTSSAMGAAVFILAVPAVVSQFVSDVGIVSMIDLLGGEFVYL